jgi:hypothetical protein
MKPSKLNRMFWKNGIFLFFFAITGGQAGTLV